MKCVVRDTVGLNEAKRIPFRFQRQCGRYHFPFTLKTMTAICSSKQHELFELSFSRSMRLVSVNCRLSCGDWGFIELIFNPLVEMKTSCFWKEREIGRTTG